ncbi:unnamed protein product [Rotaria magnacalcarata]|uniref:Uncharacterized protein n=1 Tax=Rotaria magnacalcarata TaxID=392030 RepID=A0A816U1T0_9BILA|nr:unnamed protein product [Rotaria magnacalcarata]CAF1681099.1 unnamed protein product [Rotaria magnacalcarata]CAF2035875.1 unnamed protein product [Rotaria magnacalcarata]CAF2098410.1 unnamed protein product [Rotaria magnacalcarata]CAF2104673.1 unnamed protein product [Rotaria magnacalcarata]
MSINRDSFYDDGEFIPEERSEENRTPPVPPARKSLPHDVTTTEITEDTTVTPRPPSSPVSSPRPPSSPVSSPRPPSSPVSSPPLQQQEQPIVSQPQIIEEEIRASQSSSSSSSETDDDDVDEVKGKQLEKATTNQNIILHKPNVPVDTRTDPVAVRNVSTQTETLNNIEVHSKKSIIYKDDIVFESKKSIIPLVKTLLDQTISSALPIISFCQPFSMTSHIDDIILAMPRHLMIINNQSSVSVYPWQQPLESPSTILECFWCSFLYKLLVTTLEDNCLYVYDFISVTDSIKLRGQPLSVKHQSYHLRQTNSSVLLPSSSRYQPTPAIWSQTRFMKSNSLGIYYCYISDRQYSCMLTRIDHNTRKHIKAIDCSGGSNNNNTRICAMGLSDERIAIVLTNLIMTLYDAETLLGLHQINLSRSNGYNISGISSLMYLWKTWLILDPIENKIVGIGKRKRRFIKILPEQPVNACSMDNGTLAVWVGYPGALFYYRLVE